jgi:predicted enzyme related to lactoylglutathione lyase
VNRVVFFLIAAVDPERAIEFYKNVFGWKFEKWQGPFDYWLITTGSDPEPGINGGLDRKQETDAVRTVNTISVESVDATIQKIVKNGGKVIREKTAVPGMGYLAYCADAEGVLFGIMESDISARFY